jgi:hypothetical protein
MQLSMDRDRRRRESGRQIGDRPSSIGLKKEQPEKLGLRFRSEERLAAHLIKIS